MFFPTRARLVSRPPPMHRRRNLENYAIPALRVRGARLASHATVCRAAGDLGASRNKILTIFDPYTFSRSQGHLRRRRLSSVTMTRQLRSGSGHEFNGLESVRRTLVLLSNEENDHA